MKSTLALTATLAVLSSAVLAQQAPRTYTPPPPASSQTPSPSTSSQQTPTQAQAQSSDLEAIFDKLNSSHNGKMTKAEAQAHPTVAANFDAADANHDGVLTKEEFLAAFRSPQ
jgi:Spy/CpxP family protein refolding chaperone